MHCRKNTAEKPPLAILFAIPFDSLDGRIARLTNTTSEFGKELDSLADVITFGVAPSILAYAWGFRSLPVIGMDPILRQKIIEFGAFISFVFLICGASRLARFNISHNPEPKNPGRPGRKYFVGMPIPAAAGVGDPDGNERLDAARRMLSASQLAIGVVAARTGFGSEERMRRAFQRHLKVSPASFRERFQATGDRT